MTPAQKTAAAKARAAELGFDACGVAQAGCVDPEDRLGEWLARGYHASMTWMARDPETRRDIRRKMPEARSVLVVARNYFAERPPMRPGEGRVSRYAWGADYHDVLKPPVQALADFLSALEPDASCYTSIDTGPVMERAWAARAGVGWLGKNGLLIVPDLGSWCFLAVVATSVKLIPDTPLPDRCGTCTRCIDACPTHAIVEPRQVDSTRCIAYHTIENKGDIPEALTPYFGDRVFGCDECQEVCPWNRTARPTSEPAFHPAPHQANPNIQSLRALDDAEFTRRFRNTPMWRGKRKNLLRNADLALPSTPQTERGEPMSG